MLTFSSVGPSLQGLELEPSGAWNQGREMLNVVIEIYNKFIVESKNQGMIWNLKTLIPTWPS